MEQSPILRFFLKYKWSIIGFMVMLIIGILFITLGFWATIVIIILCLIGTFFGYLKDSNRDFSTFFKNLK
ncbi:MAG: DUF2273 domain-containing protein [Kurthia sp.]|nr:DUF2273 domain-containing protein [Candidatus Kurthia equi]